MKQQIIILIFAFIMGFFSRLLMKIICDRNLLEGSNNSYCEQDS